MLSFWCPVMVVTNKVGQFPKKKDFGPAFFCPKFCVFLRYANENTLFLARTVPTQWDDNSSISWGKSGYIRFSGRCPFGHSAGRFVAPIAQSGPFGAQKCCFFVVNLKIDCYNHDGTTKRQLWLYTLTCHNISKRFAAGCYFERASTHLVDFLDKQIIILVCSWLRLAGNASQGVSIYFIYLFKMMSHQF